MDSSDAARILLRRRRMRASLTAFAQSIQIPGAPVGGDDSELFAPVGTGVARHHAVMCDAIQRCIETDYGRLILMLPPGSAKSTYASSVAPAWAMGVWPGFQTILTSYGSELAKKHGRKARAICKQGVYQDAFGGTVDKSTSAAELWRTTNGSEYMAAGILAGITGSRADLVVGDDLIAGAQEADSPATRRATWEAWEMDVMTRLKPKGSVVLLGTRWHPLDPIGTLLPEDYAGQSGPVLCTDGMTWIVLNIPAEAEHDDDPLGRAKGEMLWPEWFGTDGQHWAPHRRKPRTWSALFQQRPTLEGGGKFQRDWIQWYEPGEAPEALNYYGADDYGAPNELGTADDPDYTVLGVAGLDERGHIWLVDWWRKQGATTDEGLRNFIRLVKQWRPRRWYGEKGVIHNSIAGNRKRMQQAAQARVQVELLSSAGNKVAKAEGFFGLAEAGLIHLPNLPWAHLVVDQLCAFPVVAHDDDVDVLSLFGRALEGMAWAYVPPAEPDSDLRPFSVEWLEYSARIEATTGRTR